MRRLNFSSIDWMLLAPVAILIFISLITLFSIDQQSFKNQLFFIIFSTVSFAVISQFNFSIIKFYSKQIYLISAMLLALLLFIGIETRGSVRWIDFFGFGIQFSELLKPFLAVAFASYISSFRSFSIKSFFSVLALVMPIVLLIFLQPDLGNALIYALVIFGTLLVAGFPIRMFVLGFVLWIISLPIFWLVLRDYQRQRILTFLDPSRDPLGTSYNAIQSVITVGSGMILGKGLGQGTQTQLMFLPEKHTDFIFATISEQLGFFGSAIIILSFIFILYKIFTIAKNAQDKFSMTFSIIVFMIVFVHFVMNIGMNVGILPVVGITLPFVSYGGSSLLSNFILLGLFFSVNNKKRNEVLEIK